MRSDFSFRSADVLLNEHSTNTTITKKKMKCAASATIKPFHFELEAILYILNALSISFCVFAAPLFAAIVILCKRCEIFYMCVHTAHCSYYLLLLFYNAHIFFYHFQRKLMINHTDSVCMCVCVWRLSRVCGFFVFSLSKFCI